MPTVSAVLWKNVLFNPSFGLLAAVFAVFGLPRPDLLENHPMESIVTIMVWQWAPFMMLILLAGLQSLNHEEIEAAQMDGANRFMLYGHLRPTSLPSLNYQLFFRGVPLKSIQFPNLPLQGK